MISQEEQQQLLQLERERLAASEARRSIAEQEVIFLRAQLDDTRTNLEQALLQIRELGRRYGFDPTTQVYVSPGGYWLPQKQLFSTQAQQQQPDKEQQQAEQPPQPPHPPSEAGYATPDDVPSAVKQAMHLLISHFYTNRSAVEAGVRAAAVEMPLGVEVLLRRYRPELV